MTYRLSHLDALASEAIHIIREVVAEFERPALLFSGGKDSAVLLNLAAKACWPQRIPFPVVHVDTGHNFPEVIDYRDNQVAELDVRLVVGVGAGGHRPGIDRRAARAWRHPQPTADVHPSQGARGESLRRRLRRGPAGRGEGEGQGTGLLAAGRVRPVGPPSAAARAVEPVQHAAPSGRALPGLPALELDRAGYLAVRRGAAARPPLDLLRAPP